MEPVFGLAFRRLRAQLTQFAIAKIDPMHFAFLAFRVKEIAIGRIEYDVKTVAAGEADPIRVTDTFLALHAAGTDPVLIVLKSASNAEVRFRIVQSEPVEFSSRNAIEMLPPFPSREALINAAIGPEQQALTNRRLRRLAFVFRVRWLWWWSGARLNRERMTVGMDFFGEVFAKIPAAII